MKKFITPTLISVLMITLFSSCAINRNYQAKKGLHYTGTYTVREVDGKEVKFKEVAGTYKVDSDTLKQGDRITINVVRKKCFFGTELSKN